MGNIKKSFIFYALIILSVVSVILSWIIYSGHLKYNLINIAIETKLDKQEDIVLKVDDDYFLFKQFDDVLNLTIKKKCKNIELLINKNHKNPIKSIVLFNDVEMNYYTDFSSFEKSSDGDYKKYKFSDEIKFDKNSKMINRNILLDIFSKGVMSFFSGKLVFIFSYILLFVSILYFLNNKNDIKIKFSQKAFFISVLFLAILLRLNNISYYLPWWDEIYSINTTLANADIMKIFQDPGNPWFYYLILKIYNLIFHFDFVGMKILSVIFGIVCNILIYLFLKKYVNSKAANVGFLLSAINIPLIYYSQEIRCYIMQACFVVGFVFLIFNILENNNKKYYILYFILLICAINTHYYQIFLMISNFLFLSFFLLKEKKYKSFLNFSILNFAAILTFLPYFFYCAYNEALLNTSFNTQLPTLSSSLILNIFLYICGGIFSFVLFVLYTIKTLKNKEIELKVKNIIIYSFYTFFVVFILALIFSLIIRPMMIQRYFIFLLPLQIILISIIFNFNFKKISILIFALWVFFIQNNASSNVAQIKKKCLIDVNVLKMANIYKKNNPNKNVNVITKRKGYKLDDLYSKEINYFKVEDYKKESECIKSTADIIKDIKTKDKNAVIFTSTLLEKGIKYTCYFNSSQDMCVYKIE